MIGSRLGPYDITAKLGAGGMGEVYRATGTKLKREVAIKVLPAAFTEDKERLARFEREAQVLARLNHPNIATIYGVEESGGVRALVMEFIEGDDLSLLIARGTMPLAEAVPIAKQIAEALEAAHELGIVHRDLKPANIKVRSDGSVKVLDFGLAKIMDPLGSSREEVANSPTLTSGVTRLGMPLGTAAYMAPEQARGKAVDRRADIWAFGVVLYEMLTGRRAFEGDDIAITLARVLRSEVNWQALPVDLPMPLRRLLWRCLQADPGHRLRSMGDAYLELEEAESPGDRDSAGGPRPVAAAVAPVWRRAIPWAIAGLFAIVLVFLRLIWVAPSQRAPAPRRLLASIGADASIPTTLGASAILSPDGTTLAFVGRQTDAVRLFIRKLDQLQATALAGTEGASSPFFSPDGQWIGFFAESKLKKVSVTGGAPFNLSDAPRARGGTWADDDTIIFSPTGLTRLMRVSAAGGTPEVFGTFSEGATNQRWPQALPGGKGVLCTENSSAYGGFDGANIVIVPRAGGRPKIVVRGGYSGRYLPSGLGSARRAEPEVGHLVYMQLGRLFAVPFDLERLDAVGPAVPALDGVAANSGTAGAQMAVSSEGTLVYVPGASTPSAFAIDWMTRDGKTSPLLSTKSSWLSPRFSPDGRKLALDIVNGNRVNIWVYEWAQDRLTQLTFDPAEDRGPVWTPDGRSIVFASNRGKGRHYNLYSVNVDGTGEVTRLTDSPNDQVAGSWHPTGKFMAFSEIRGATGLDLMILPMEGDAARGWTSGKPTVFLSTPTDERQPMFSPDGRWIAYASNESGAYDVYARPFPGPGGTWRVSTGGGAYPRWSATAHELLFLGPDTIMTATYVVDPDSFRAQKPQIWSPTRFDWSAFLFDPYDLHPDGKRLAIRAASEQGSVAQDKVVFVFNFFDYLRKIAPENN